MDLKKHETESGSLAKTSSAPSALASKSNTDVLGRINQFADRYTLVLEECDDEDDDLTKDNQLTSRKLVPVQVSSPRLVETLSNTSAAALSEDPVSIIEQQVEIQEPIPVQPWSENAVLAAHDGNGIIVVAEASGESPNLVYTLRYHVVKSQVEKSVTLPEKPHSLHVLGSAVYVGLSREIGWVNFDDPHPAFVSLYQREWQHKAYDMFARKGSTLVAVDDCIYPFYADTFDVPGTGGEPVHLEGWELPDIINGQYNMTAILGNSLILIHNFAHRGGEGQTITRVSLLEMKDKRSRTSILLSEINPWNGKKVELITDHPGGNDPMTRWMGLAVNQNMNEIYLAAGRRGLLVLPGDFQSTTKAANVDLKGCVTSVSVPRDGETWATVQTHSQTELVKVSANKSVERRMVLPGTFKLI